MRSRVVDAHAEIAAAAVHVEGPRLEDAPGSPVVEIVEVDEVAQEPVQVALVMRDPHGVGDGVRLRGELLVLGDQRLDARFGVAPENRLDAGKPQLLDRRARLRRHPGFVRGVARPELLPLDRGDLRLLRPVEGRDGDPVEGGQRARPGRVHALEQGKGPAGSDPGKWQAGQLRRLGDLLGGEARIVFGDPAAVEPVVHFHPDRPRRFVDDGRIRVRIPAACPPCIAGQLAKERVELALIDPRLAGAIGHASDAVDRLGDHLAQLRGLRRVFGDDSVAIEPGALEDPADVGDVGDRERYRVRVPAPGEYLPGRSEQCPPRGFRLVDRVQRQTVRPGDERVQVLEPFFAPAERSEDLRSADAPVLVEIQ